MEAQTSESEMESDGMLKTGHQASDRRRHMGMAGSLLSCKSTSAILKVSLHSYLERKYLARTHSPASKDYPCQA